MKKSISIMMATLMAAFSTTLVGCSESESIHLNATGELSTHGEQTIEINIDQDYSDYSFQESISIKDISFSDAFDGKSVQSVTYNSASSISVTISGTLTSGIDTMDKSEGIVGGIYVNGGISNNAVGSVYVRAFYPEMITTTAGMSAGTTTYTFSSTFKLPYGSFVEEYLTSEYITLPNDNGTISLTLTDAGYLHVAVSNFTRSDDYSYPVISMAAEVTTFNKTLYTYVGVAMTHGSGVDLL